MISIVILTLNEEVNLPRCLKAISWCDDVLIVDLFSSDGTLRIAAEHGVRVVQRAFDSFAGQRNFAVEHCELKYDCGFHLDADEVMAVYFAVPASGSCIFCVPSASTHESTTLQRVVVKRPCERRRAAG